MSAPITFFSDPQFNNRIKHVADLLRGVNNQVTDDDRSRYRLGVALDIIANNPVEFDDKCQFNIKNIGSGFTSIINESSGLAKSIDLPRLNALTFRFVSEFDISMGNELSLELKDFLRGVISECESYPPDYKSQIEYAQKYMPVGILKAILNSEEFSSLRDVQGIAKETNDKVDIWKKELQQSEVRVNALQAVLKEQRTEFNFVGLSKGFFDLEKTIKGELELLQARLPILGCLALIPIILEAISVAVGWIDASNDSPFKIIASAVISVTATLLFLYFFRITLRSADICKAQLIQVRLRMTLCQFIHNYADYSNDVKSKNPDALSKFENLIFAGIVNTDDKLPSTFDGMEQLSGLFKAVHGDSK